MHDEKFDRVDQDRAQQDAQAEVLRLAEEQRQRVAYKEGSMNRAERRAAMRVAIRAAKKR